MAKVVLVGAGPGDEELITLKGLKAIQWADVILYDALVNKELLKYASSKAKLIDVGKRANKHKYSQDEINHLLVDYGSSFNVVRLKGGDPFVFGRGAEEMTFLEENGVEVEVVPGISSAVAVPELQGIPLTKRNVSDSFMVVTGTNSNGMVSKDLIYGAKSNTTLIVLMGLRNISQIIDEVLLHRHGYTPFAILQSGSLKNEKIIIDSLHNYKVVINEINYNLPGIIVIGDVVAEHPLFLTEEIHRVLEILH